VLSRRARLEPTPQTAKLTIPLLAAAAPRRPLETNAPRSPTRKTENRPRPTQAANALTFDELQGLTYLQVKGSGIANTCPVLEGGSTNLKDLKAGNYKFDKFCIEPTSFTVKEDSQVGYRVVVWWQ